MCHVRVLDTIAVAGEHYLSSISLNVRNIIAKQSFKL